MTGRAVPAGASRGASTTPGANANATRSSNSPMPAWP